MYQSIISGVGKYHPSRVVTNDELSKRVDTSDEWIVQRTGIKERRISASHEFPSFMAHQAALLALKQAQLQPNDIDLILFATTIPDRHFPNTASRLQALLGITNQCGCVDLNAACTGWVYSMTMAQALIATGAYQNILVVGCDRSSAFNNWDDRNTCILFGDGAGVVVLSRNKENSQNPEAKIFGHILGSDSSKQDALSMPKGGSETPPSVEIIRNKENFMTMDGQTVFKAAVKTMSSHCQKLLTQHGLSLNDIQWFIPHQANLRIIETTASLLNFPLEKVIINVEKYANTSSASIPAALFEAIEDGRVKRGDKILMATFGSGLTSGALLLEY
jgi:3-oxoacyl-[acyl-carrier-protein] synthase-3